MAFGSKEASDPCAINEELHDEFVIVRSLFHDYLARVEQDGFLAFWQA